MGIPGHDFWPEGMSLMPVAPSDHPDLHSPAGKGSSVSPEGKSSQLSLLLGTGESKYDKFAAKRRNNKTY